jgi:16S rRNA (uracil1498-N3)-methyltransferase
MEVKPDDMLRQISNLYYAPELNRADSFCVLGREESVHCMQVMRKAAGGTVFLTNGRGLIASGVVEAEGKGVCKVRIVDISEDRPSAWKLEMGVAPTKNADRFGWFAEKAAEIGIDAIHPLICKHSERKIINPERMNRLLIAAMKQSRNAFLPMMFPACTFQEMIAMPFEGQKMIAHCGDGNNPALHQALEKGRNVLILIGPEGDFSMEEVRLAEKNGFISISLGKNRLRTETAALLACHTAHLINQQVNS